MNQKEEVEIGLEALEIQLATLEKELEEERKLVENKEKQINSNPEMKKLIEKQKELKEEQSVVGKQKEKLEKKIKEQFIEIKPGWTHPSFQHKTYEWAEDTNIWCDVLSEISKHSPLYLLRNEDIDNAVGTLIDKAINKCPELGELIKQSNSLGERLHDLWEKERSLDRGLRKGFHSKTYDLQQTISKIKEQIANPKKFIEQQRRYSKRDEARNKLKDPKILDEIYKKLEIEIPKVKTNVKPKKE